MKTTQRGYIFPLLTTPLLLASVSQVSAQPDYPYAYWRPVYSGHWYTSGYGHKFHVIHDMEGYYWTTISYFQRSTTQASVHFYVNGKTDNGTDAAPGEVSQGVRTAYYAWHALCWNQHSTGTEHEGFASNPAWYTPQLYQASADLTRWLGNNFGWPKDRNHIVGHGEKANSAWVAWAGPNLGINPTCNTHTDPGPYWDWIGYMARVNPPSGPPTINPPYVFDSDGQGWTSGNSMSALTWTACCGWPGIIYNDQTGNDAFNYSPPCNFTGGGDPSVNVSFYPQSGNTANHDMQVFWKTAQDNSWTASKSSPIVTYSAQNNWVTLNLDINANWPGYFQKTVNQFRLDFDNNNSGTRWIVNHFITQTTPRFWFTSSTDGWNAGNSIVTPWWTDCCGWPGILVADQNGNDAFITKDVSGLGYRGAQNDRIYIRLFPQGGSGVNHDAKVYWATSLENFYSEAKSSALINYSGKDTWIDLWFDVGANGYWYGNGPITSLRVDFDANNQGVRWIVDQIQVVHNGSANFPPYNNSSVVSISAPSTVNAGAAFSATVTMNNSGTKAWTADGTPHGLGSQSPQDNTTWGFTRVGLPGGTAVNPGQNVTFTINATAPSTPGSYAFDWKMVEDGVQWFGPIAQATINVINPGPTAPSALAATAPSYSQVNLTWTDNSSNETGFKVERSTDNVNFSVVATLGANVTSYSDTGRSAATTYYYRVKSYNSGGDSTASNTASITTPNQPPDLATIGDKTGTEGQLLTFTASSSNPNQQVTTTTFQDLESFADNTANDTVMFRKPANSATTSAFLDASTNYTSVRSSFPAGHSSAKVLKAGWGFATGTSNPWLRLNTFNPVNVPNPTIDFDQIVRFDIYSDKSLKVGVGVRETGTTAAYGANGGTTGTIEWVGVPSATSGSPNPSQTVAANTWTTLSFNIPFESVTTFTGDGIVSSGVKGVLEELALVPNGGMGAYTIYLDNFAVVAQNTLTYSLDAGAPVGASIHPKTGVFKWTPSSGQSGNYAITVRVTDRLGLTDFETINVSIVAVGNHAPVLGAIGNKTVNEGSALTFTASATDQDSGQTLTFSLDTGAPAGASINSSTGAFSWTPTEAQGPGSYPITVRVTDNGSPATNDFETITVTVNEVNTAPVLATISDQTVNEGSTLSLTASATDSDVPANSITYSLDVGAPVGMSINASSGALSWTTTESHGPGVYPVTVRATDNAAPALSSTSTFNVTVNEVNIAPTLTLNTTLTNIDGVTDFEAFAAGTYNGTVLFRQPSFSSSTSAFIEGAVTNLTTVTTTYPGNDGINKVLYATWSYKTGTTNPWIRLTTFNTVSLPNPTISFVQRLRFKVYSDKALGVALGVRETNTGASIGQNGGTTGALEWVGATVTGSSPVPTHTVPANTWTTLEFNLPQETITAFPSSGNGVLNSTTGKGVLDHLALTPAGGTGVYNVYFDNLEVVTVTTNLTVNNGETVTFNSSASDADFPAQTLTFSLATNAPAGATINPSTGAFSWTPTSTQAPSTNVITVIVTDNGPGNLSASQNVTIVVNRINSAPHITGVPTQSLEVQGGGTINLTVTATDDDGDPITFSLQGTVPPGATINATTGVFNWTPPNSLSTNVITIRASDNGTPPLYDEQDMTILVTPTNTAPTISLGGARVVEPVANFETFANNTSNGNVMFRRPNFSSSTTAFMDASTNYTTVTTSFPAGNSRASGKVLKAGWGFATGTTNPWMRLTTSGTANLPNPTIDLTARVKFDIYSDKSMKVGLGVRETGTTAAIGDNGGTTGGIEWLGAIKVGTSPNPSRVVNANTWTTLEFVLPTEYCTNFSGGDSVLASGKGVLEHLALVPNGGMGAYTVYLDNFEVVTTPALPGTVSINVGSTFTLTVTGSDPDPGSGLQFGLDADAPAGTSIDINTGAFTWTPAAGGTTNTITIFVNDNPTNGAPVKSASQTITAIVNADPFGPQNSDGVVAIGESAEIQWDSVAGHTYKLQYREGESDWIDYGTVTATEPSSSVTVESGVVDRVYRIIELADTTNE